MGMGRGHVSIQHLVPVMPIIQYGYMFHIFLKDLFSVGTLVFHTAVFALKLSQRQSIEITDRHLFCPVFPIMAKKRADEIGLNPNQNRKSCIYREKGGSKTDRSQYFRRRASSHSAQ